jgi:hypothetical protein
MRGGILALVPVRETLEKQLEAAEGSSAETVNGLIIVADHDDVAGVTGEQLQQFELRDVGVLKLVDQDVLEALLKFDAAFRVVAEEGDRLANQTVNGNSALLVEDFLAGTVGPRDFLL